VVRSNSRVPKRDSRLAIALLAAAFEISSASAARVKLISLTITVKIASSLRSRIVSLKKQLVSQMPLFNSHETN
jgi:hypothetical protein